LNEDVSHHVKSLLIFTIACMGLLPVRAQDKAPATTTPVRMTVTLRLIDEDKRMPEVNREDVIVRQDKDRVQVTGWTPACGDHAGLDLFILIDDAVNTSLGSQLGDLRAFINAQPPTTSVGVGYMRNGTANRAELHNPPRGAGSILSSKVKLGAGVSAAAGPNDREAIPATDVGLRAEVLSYSRSRGLCGRFPRWLYATTG
jgi:hypothetical protein